VAEVLTDEMLSAAFGVPLRVRHDEERWSAVLRHAG
jgi:hypothetical protein